MSKKKQIALLIESSRALGRGVLLGIARFAQIHGGWVLYHQERSLSESAPRWLSGWSGDGIIARIDSQKLLDQIRLTGLPAVDMRLSFQTSDIPAVGVDNRSATQMAAEHLLERKFEHYAACGFAGINYSEERCQLFAEYLAARGHEVAVWLGSTSSRAMTTATIEALGISHEQELHDWLSSLPKPVGILATNDVRGQQILNACGLIGLAVPDEVAVLGIDNDPVICEICHPRLSSIELDTDRMGYEAAETLDALMRGEQPKQHQRLLRPRDLIVRQSTDVVAIPDAETAAAVRFIREHACEGIDVPDVLRHVACSRSTLERRFAQFLDRSPLAEIIRVRLRKVKQLLTATDYPLSRIAELAGFNHVEYMCNLFKEKYSQTPGQYRRQWKPRE